MWQVRAALTESPCDLSGQVGAGGYSSDQDPMSQPAGKAGTLRSVLPWSNSSLPVFPIYLLRSYDVPGTWA